MKKEKVKKIPTWIWVLIGIVVVYLVMSNPLKSRQEKFLEGEGYELNSMFCSDITNEGHLEMETYSSREDQVTAGFIALNTYCPDAENFGVMIIEPSKRCLYSMNADLYRAYSGEEYNEEKLMNSMEFLTWEGNRKKELEKPDPDLMVLLYYQEYLEEGLTQMVLYDVIEFTFEVDHQICKEK
jgi:hypothetical protein